METEQQEETFTNTETNGKVTLYVELLYIIYIELIWMVDSFFLRCQFYSWI